MWTCLCQGTRKARKEHRCYFCNEPILLGQQYDFRTGADCDGVYTMKMHPECNQATRAWTQDDYEVFGPGELKRGTAELE